ncbi:MAG: CPBP family intramembrane glutamic endopeptidase, partial [Chitinophagales bacterium]
GIGEEWFFRAGLQPYLGIWATALLFVLIHGYLDFRNRPLFICGLFLVIMSAGLGYLYEYIGLASAMIAHGVYDLIVLCRLLYREPRFFRVK